MTQKKKDETKKNKDENKQNKESENKQENIEKKIDANKKKLARDNSVGFPIVGIGASAGGLEAFKEFFSGMPDDSEIGMAFVLIQHLAPDHESSLTEIIRNFTSMRGLEVKDEMKVAANSVYIIPPNYDIS